MAFSISDLRVLPFRRASQPLLNTGTTAPDIKQAHDRLQTYLDTEFGKVEDSIASLINAAPQVAFKEPEVKMLGMIRYAKSPWNPLGSGNGWVYWNGSAWAAL